MELKKVCPQELILKVREYADRKREHLDALKEKEAKIKKTYDDFDSESRIKFFSLLYDEFSQNYDKHMGEETNHYHAMKKLLDFVRSEIKFPLLDISSGTGEMIKWIKGGEITANEISPKMQRISIAKNNVNHTSFNAVEIPWEEEFRTVLCSQTLHIVSEEDKIGIIRSIRKALKFKGLAIIMEEDPFRITDTLSIEPISMFLRSVCNPISPRKLIAHFELNGFKHLELSAQAPIDEFHVMKVHLFESQ